MGEFSGILVLLAILFIFPYRRPCFILSTFSFSVIDILILLYLRCCNALYLTYNTYFSLGFAMVVKRFRSKQAPVSQPRACIGGSLPLRPLPSTEPSPPPRARLESPSPATEEQSDPASPPKRKTRIKLNVKRPRPKIIIKRKPPPIVKPRPKIIIKRKPPPVVEPPVEISGNKPPTKIKIIFKRKFPAEEPPVAEPLAEISGNRPPKRIKLKLNPTR
jgi:hypothetical protein